MKNVQTFDSRKASMVLACAITISLINGTQSEVSQPEKPIGTLESDIDCNNAEVIIDPIFSEQQKNERANRLSRKFEQLTEQWKNEHGSLSSINEMSMLPSYQSIIGMGADALPLILAQIKTEGDDPDQWFWALKSIADANDFETPTMNPEDQGNFARMAERWLEWGAAQGYAG